nr:ATP-binding protein [Pacificimonas pallii]
MGLNRLDEARPLLDEALRNIQNIAGADREKGEILRTSAVLYYQQGKIDVSLSQAVRAHDLLRDARVPASQAKALILMGVIYRDAGDYERTLRYYQSADKLFDGGPTMRLSHQNNLGFVYEAMGRHQDALQAYRRANVIAADLGSPLLRARIATNLAKTEMEVGDLEGARRSLDVASRLVRAEETAAWRPYVLGTRAKLAALDGRNREAADLLDQAFEDADLTATPTTYRDFHEIAVNVYRRQARPEDALEHFAALKRLDDEAAQASASANNAILAAQFDFAGQEVEIANLRTSQLESDVQMAEERALFNQRVVFGVLAASAIIISLTLIALYIARRRRLEVDAANVELGQTNAELEKALNAKSEFLATTSHEIRTPLNGVLGMTQIMLADRNLPDDVRERVALVHGAGTSMKAIVDDILDVAKMESGVVALRREPFDLRDTLEEVSRIFADSAAEKGLDYHIDLGACPARAIGDEQRVRQVVLNLVSNAVKFTSEGHVRLSARPAADDTDALHIEISDSGIGIPEGQQDAVFEAFHQVDGTRTRAFSGTGLGLTISRELVLAMHGDLKLESALGKGTCFTLKLPLSLEIANAGQRPDEAAPSNRSIVLYAANALIEMIATRALGEAAAGVDVSHDHGEAVASARTANGLVLAYSTAGQAADIEHIVNLRRDCPHLFIAAAGWPADTGIDAHALCDMVVDDVASLGQVGPNLMALGEDGGGPPGDVAGHVAVKLG